MPIDGTFYTHISQQRCSWLLRYGAAYGHPFMIDVLDCDVRLPTPDDPNDPETQLTKPNCYLAELIKLSILLGKVIKTIYSPSGLVHATDPILETLLGELDQWKANLRPDLAFTGPNSILPAGEFCLQDE